MPTEFDNIVSKFSNNIKRTLQFVPDHIKHKCEEIRLRVGLPVCLTVGGQVVFVCQNSTVCNLLPANPIIATQEDVNTTLALMCNRSLYLHENEIRQGFVSLQNGCRVGVCGTFNSEGMLVSVSSINVRIARQIFGCADCLVSCAGGGLLIAGPPRSGKTTILRDVVRLLSNGAANQYFRVVVVDTRGEISGGGRLDLGVGTDVLNTTQKSKGIDIALRTMSPDFIVFDEIGTMAELNSVRECFNSGVGIITTAHCSDKKDIMLRNVTRGIVESAAVERVVILSQNFGEAPQIITCEEFKNVYC